MGFSFEKIKWERATGISWVGLGGFFYGFHELPSNISRERQWIVVVRLSRWDLPALGWPKLNTNGSSRGNTGKEGNGYLIRMVSGYYRDHIWCTKFIGYQWQFEEVGSEAYGSSLWKAISKGGADFFLRSRFAIGNGVSFKFWQDPWYGENPLNDYLWGYSVL